MERLTVKVDEFFAPKKLCTVNRYEEVDDCDSCVDCCKQHGEGSNTCNGCPIQECFDRLGVYENLDEQGLLLKLPCKVGDVVWCIYLGYTKCTEHNQEFDECACQGCECLECDSRKVRYVESQKAYSLDWIISNLNNFGKIVFLTQEEALEEIAK